jgi:hypothetical protein
MPAPAPPGELPRTLVMNGMQIRLRLGRGVHVHRKANKNQKLALAVASLLAPMVLVAALLAVWRIAAGLGIAQAFAFESGPLAHWASWGAVAFGLGWAAHRLNRYGRGLP